MDWGDVPSWIGVVLAIVVPLIAYFERNRIAGFFRRKAAEPLPKLPPARFLVRPNPAGAWLLLNMGQGEAFNVQIDVEDATASVLTSGFWPSFLAESYGTFNLQLSQETMIYGDVALTTVSVRWDDANGEGNVAWLKVGPPSSYTGSSRPFPITDAGKVLPLSTVIEPDSDDG